MFVRVTCAGVVVGTAEFNAPEGVAYSLVRPTAGYACATAAAWRLAHQLACTQFWSPSDGDFAVEAARRWDGDRLALQDEAGRELSVNSVVLLEGLPGDGATTVRVVADFRSDLAGAGANVPSRAGGDGARSRPAA